MGSNVGIRARVGLEPSINQAFLDIHMLTSDLPVLRGFFATVSMYASRLMMNPAQGSQLQRPSDDLYALPYFVAPKVVGLVDIRIHSNYYLGIKERYTYGFDPENLGHPKDVDPMGG
jgi:hypothetical protein